jgi:hypothetical protein
MQINSTNKNKDLSLVDTNIIIFYSQGSQQRYNIRDQQKIEKIFKIMIHCQEKKIKFKINSKIQEEIKYICKKENLYFDIDFFKINTLFCNKEVLDEDKATIIDWYEKENGMFDQDDMLIFYLEQNERNLEKQANIIFTDNIKDFKICKEIYQKYYLEYRLGYREISIKGIEDFEEYLKIRISKE